MWYRRTWAQMLARATEVVAPCVRQLNNLIPCMLWPSGHIVYLNLHTLKPCGLILPDEV